MDNRRPWHRYSLIYHTLRSRGPYTESTYLYPQFSTSDLLAQPMPKQRPFIAYTLEDAKRIIWRLIQRTNCHMVSAIKDCIHLFNPEVTYNNTLAVRIPSVPVS